MILIFESEIELVLASLKKCRIRARVLKCRELFDVSDVGVYSLLGEKKLGEQLFEILPKSLEPHTVYKIESAFKLHYICLLISKSDNAVLFVGPYLSEPYSRTFVLEIGEKNGVSPKHMKYLDEYYGGLAVLEENSPIFFMLDSLCERIWSSPSFSIVKISEQKLFTQTPIIETRANGDEDIQISMKALEQRYEFENEMILAVSQGQIHKEKQLLAAFSDNAFEKRIADRVRNAKNYCVIMNTLLRKAAERGGVHPFYIDKVSSDFAAKIERMTHINENGELMREMFRSYCRLVRKHSTGRFSMLCRKLWS